MRGRFEALCFDLDNTLIDRNRAWQAFLEGWLRDRFPHTPATWRKRTLAELVALDRHGWAPSGDVDAHLVKALGLDDREVNRLRIQWRGAIPRLFTPDPAVTATLAALAPQLPMALVSNGSGENQRRKLAAAGLISFFPPEFIFISGERRCAKPEPGLFQAALAALGTSAAATLFIGDDPVRDILGAHAIGMATCWISNGRADVSLPQSPDMIISSIPDLEGFVHARHEPHTCHA